MRLNEKRRETVRVNDITSGNVETVADMELLLDDLIHEKDKWKEQVQAERKSSTKRDRKLVAAGEEMWCLPLTPERCHEEGDDDEEVRSTEINPKKQRNSTKTFENVSACLVDTAERRRVMDESKLAVEKKQFECEIKRAQKLDEHFELTQAVAERRRTLDERRFELGKEKCKEYMKIDKEERKEEREERKAMLSFIRKLMKK